MRIRSESKDPNQDGSQESHYRYSAWVTLTNLVPGVPAAISSSALTVTPGNTKLDVSWTAPANNGSAISGYDVHYTSATLSNVANGAAVQTVSAAAGWLAVSRSGTAASQSITGLANDTAYRVRVRARNTHGSGAWVFGAGTPKALVWSFAPTDYRADEGLPSNIRIQLTVAAPAGGVTFTLTPLFGTSVPSTTHSRLCDDNSGRAERADLGTAVPTTLTVQAGKTIGEARFPFVVDAVEDHNECFAIRAATNAAGVTLRTGTQQYDVAHVLIREKVPDEPTGLTVAPGNTKLDLSWTASQTGVVAGYDVHYTSAPTSGNGAVTNGAAVQTVSAAAGWLAVSRSGTTASQSITGLANDTAYRVRVRARNSGGHSVWVHGTGTPQTKTFTFKPVDGYVVPPGTNFGLRIQLSEAAPAGGLAFTLTQKLGTAVPTGLCDDGEVKATAEDIGANPPTTLTVQAGETVGRANYPSAANGDDRVGRLECFAVQASTAASDWAAASDGADTAEMRIGVTQTIVAFGTARPLVAVPNYAAAVSEGAGTVSVPVTVGYLPASSTTVTVEVAAGQGGGTATEYVDAQNPGDFRIQTKSVTFGPNDASRTQNLSVAITDDSDEESSETIVLRLTTTGQISYVPLATRGGRATLTIQDNETPPVASGTMTVGIRGSWKGFQATPSVGALSGAEFTAAGVGYRILALQLTNSGWLDLQLDRALPRDLGLVLDVGATRFKFVDAVVSTGPGYEGVMASWGYANQGATPPSWRDGEKVPVSLGASVASTVKLFVRPNPVKEGSWVSVEACLSVRPQGRTRIPVTLSHGTSEAGDWGVSRSGNTDGSLPVRTAESIVIDDWFQSRCGSVNIPTHWDDDTADETFTVGLGSNLPPGAEAGTPSTVEVTILDQVENARLRDLEMTTGN